MKQQTKIVVLKILGQARIEIQELVTGFENNSDCVALITKSRQIQRYLKRVQLLIATDQMKEALSKLKLTNNPRFANDFMMFYKKA